jgi:transglutaminase-like putative cysteine protease
MNYRVIHKTEYLYTTSVVQCHNEGRLLPRNFAKQTCSEANLNIDPPPNDYRIREDFFGNRVAYFAIHQPHTRLTVTATSQVQVAPEAKELDFYQNSPWEDVAARLRANSDPGIFEARQYTMDSPMIHATRELAQYAKASFPKGKPMVDAVHDLMQRIHRDFSYDPHFTTLATPLAQVLKHRRGVCQDFAHLAIGCIRAQGLAARYVSGYIETLPPPGQQKLAGADASHAWFSVYEPDTGWLDFDPTNNQMPMDRHIIVAWGRDYSDVTPVKGVIFGGGKHKLNVSVDVERINS